MKPLQLIEKIQNGSLDGILTELYGIDKLKAKGYTFKTMFDVIKAEKESVR